ncbi:BMP family lipoprotein [Spirochaeta isovalerica]|uniref:Basic membrane protein A n=1 Tax=Spirochaeta isovalerica TaxID=150 RepID=A0A841R852_9SPIO|nr:BMP family ABC transporter substrate-binding protein [Spirochaeta isovalerica]MBB6479210.1 basic membrane protein A [Spirochaeta isovalerica]
MKKVIVALLAMMLVANFAFANGQQGDSGAAAPALKVGMVTDSGTIDDKSFNQGTWEGILEAEKDFGVTTKYLKPVGETEADYLKEIGNLYDAGFTTIVTPGFKFEAAIFAAQDKWPEANFVILDGTPHSADYSEFRAEKNVVSIFFSEHESGFLAGYAAALQIKEGEMGFIGGMEIPAVQKFNWGFQQGVAYANKNNGTNIKLNAENIIYQGTFTDVAAGQQLAAQMYDKGVDAIFAAAGGVGVGVINEAKSRVKTGEKVWVIGVDVNQYPDGVYEGNKSVVITSAMKRIDVAAYDMVKAVLDGTFPGGETLIFDAKNNGVGIPAENPNLDASVEAEVAKVFAKLQDGSVVVAAEQGNLIK